MGIGSSARLHSSGIAQGQVAVCCEHGDERSVCIKCWEFLD